jgi:hypothetical protein
VTSQLRRSFLSRQRIGVGKLILGWWVRTATTRVDPNHAFSLI